MKTHISVVSLVYKAEDSIDELVKRTIETILKITDDFEIILVEDGSPDNSWMKITENCKNDRRVKGIRLSRNFGQHNAIFAGLENSNGKYIVVMDCDLQDKPEEIENFYKEMQKGFDLVVGSKENRQDRLFKKLFSETFYVFLSYLTETKQDSSVGNYGIYSRKVIDSVLQMQDNIKYFPTMIKWVGFRKSIIKIEHSNRIYGKTSYKFRGLLKLALNTILSFSDKPLRLVVKTGLIISFISIVFALYNLYEYFTGKILVLGWASVIISIWFFSGVLIFVLGIIGLYIGRIFDKVKDRPTFIIKDHLNK